MISVALDRGRGSIADTELAAAIERSVSDCRGIKRLLLIVPDFTRYHSNSGQIANLYYHLFKDRCRVDLLVAVGTHVAMTREECAAMYGDIPYERFVTHNWRSGNRKLGQVPGDFVAEVSEGLMTMPIDVEVDELLWAGYDLILSIGQVVPHEVVGMANHSKNIFVGCGGSSMINASHMLGAFYGMERIMGRDHSPVRKVFDYAAKHYLGGLPLTYVLTVTTAPYGKIRTHGLYISQERHYFEAAVAQAQQTNLTFVDKPLKKVVVYLDDNEFKSTWLGNKSIYRTRMAIADGGELIVLAPGVDKFGEDAAIDSLIRKYGYAGREAIIQYSKNGDLQNNLSAAAHLIHGSSDGRFSITYCTCYLTRAEVESVNFQYRPYEEATVLYDPGNLYPGFNTVNGEEIYFIPNPAMGLWVDKAKFTV
ncbi:MAG: lactate racemase domain-containing protein [Spirochaetaceae bacterium]|jgi:nickel-dependent lactate racemase|nr:lactate racemase domain-containing protein [Spirochaetaceae bacterium]